MKLTLPSPYPLQSLETPTSMWTSKGSLTPISHQNFKKYSMHHMYVKQYCMHHKLKREDFKSSFLNLSE